MTNDARPSFLILKDIDQSSNVRRDLHRELIARLQRLLGFLAHPYSCGSPGDDDCACRQSRTLGQEAHQFWDPKDKVTTELSAMISVLQRALSLHTLADNPGGPFHSSTRESVMRMDLE